MFLLNQIWFMYSPARVPPAKASSAIQRLPERDNQFTRADNGFRACQNADPHPNFTQVGTRSHLIIITDASTLRELEPLSRALLAVLLTLFRSRITSNKARLL